MSRLRPIAVLGVLLVFAAKLPAHDHSHPTAEELQAAKDDGTYEARKSRLMRSNPHRLSSGLAQRAAFKLRRAALKAEGLTPREVANRLNHGPQAAFPFTSPRELKSLGTVQTLTILVDFKDHKAVDELPGLDSAGFQANIYGTGTPEAQSFVPYESLNAYYRRASQDRVNVLGSVLGWYHFPEDRSEYEPQTAAPGPGRPDRQAVLDNQAIFEMVVEAMESQDSQHDFSQYDNDNDGDIDLVTILYAGPDNGWGNFWWAYRWQFFVQGASSKRFDGKRLKQFVFQFVNTRGPNNDDFEPRTLLHEMGHAFGLADYYDYEPAEGPQGGVGGLDMMHSSWGNHNAFSRWLLDWVEPQVIGNAAPATTALIASGSPTTRDKAIAIFPGLSDSDAPTQEMFLIENRSRFGNDAGAAATPGDGVLIWHVDATVNAFGNDFEYDNSFTTHKLIRLVRANTPSDFVEGELASAATYFRAGSEFTPSSTPSSDGRTGPTYVAMNGLSPPGETMDLRVGILPPPPLLAQLSASTIAASESAVEVNNLAASIKQDFAASSTPEIDLDRLEELDRTFTTATPEQLESLWRELAPRDVPSDTTCQASLTRQVLLTHWAAKDGPKAVRAIQQLPDCEYQNATYALAMLTWANSDAESAAKWYFDESQRDLRESPTLVAGPKFAETIIECCARSDLSRALGAIEKLTHPSELWGAVHGLREVNQASGADPQQLQAKLRELDKNAKFAEAIRNLQESIDDADQSLSDPTQKEQLRKLLQDNLESHDFR